MAPLTAPKLANNGERRSYEVARDGQRFLFNATVLAPEFASSTLELHWTVTLKK
jgi:hypothetical protein